MASPELILEKLADQASQYCINLNELVDREPKARFRGGNALVFQGTLRPRGARVAVKTIQGALNDLQTIKTAFREAHVWSKLRHENILPFFGITTKFDLTVSIVSKWMMAGNAHDYVQDPTIDPRPLMAGIVRGMCYLHTHPSGPIIHGDLKGSNVLISDEGHALITDFGYTSLANASFNMTVVAPKGGTMNWMSPEIIESIGTEHGCSISIEGDIWAYGMTCLELFTRQVPFPNLKIWVNVMSRILKGPPERPSDNVTYFRMSDEWWDISFLCWARDPLLRPSLSELLPKVEKTKAIANTTQLLTQLSQRANYFCINLDDQVDRDTDIAPLRDSNAIICRGALRPVGTKITVKTVRAGLPAGDKQTIEEVLREVHLWSGLCHKNIVPLLGITTKFDHTITIVSKWTEPRNAQEYVQDGHIDPCQLLLGIAEGLSYLHKYKSGPLCHGDMRGLNVMVSEDGQALLTFGVATLINALFLPAAMSLRRPANWASPEELESGQFVKAPEADVWAFGMTALELFTRKPPFHCIESEDDVKARVLRDPPNRPSDEETCSRLTDGWWDICLPCWRRNPSLRPDMTEIAGKIKLLIRAVSVTPHSGTGTLDNTSKSLIAEQSNPKTPPSDQANDKSQYPKQHPPLSQNDTPNPWKSNGQSPQQRDSENGVTDLRFTDLWRKLTKSREFTEVLPTDILVFIVGPTGSGKSWFLREIVKKENIQFIKRLKPSTKEVNAVRCHFSDDDRDDIVIVDTPSFYTYLRPDGEVALKQWVNEKCRKPCKGAGILYLHNIAANPQDANLSLSKHLQAFNRAYTCGAVSSTVVVPTLDNALVYPPDKTQRLTSRLKSEAKKVDAITCKLFDGQPETAWEIIQELLKSMENGQSPQQCDASGNRITDSTFVPSNRGFTDLWRKLVKSPDPTEILPTDIVVFIVGPTGSGKSWLLRELVKNENIEFSKQGLKPSTKEVNAIRCHFIDDNRYDIIIVDTPSFYTYLKPDGEVILKQWINEKCKRSCKGAGILYLHNIAANLQDANLSLSKHLQAFNRAYTCGAVSSTVVVPTLDDGVVYPSDKIQRLISRLESEAEKVDATTWRLFDGRPDTAWEMVQELLKHMGCA